jgi:hypothetical protein
VVVVSALVGIGAGRIDSPLFAGAKPKAKANARIGSRNKASARERPEVHFHARMEFDGINHGGPGELVIHGVFEIGDPNFGTPDRDLAITAVVMDLQGHVLIDHHPIMMVKDQNGVGYWSQEVTFATPMLPGEYSAGFYAGVPGALLTKLDGSKVPHYDAHMRSRVKVK